MRIENEIILYPSEDGQTKVEVRMEGIDCPDEEHRQNNRREGFHHDDTTKHDVFHC